MNKLEIQQRVLQNGKPLDLDKFEWDEKTNTFSSAEDYLVIDLKNIDHATITAGYSATINAGWYATITAGDSATITAGDSATINAVGEKIVIVNRNVFEVIQPNEGDVIQICPHGIAGHLVNGKFNGVPHIIVDSILSKIINKKGNVYKVVNYGETEQSYLIKQGDIYSHGKTLREAQESLIYKLTDKDTSAYESMTLETIVTKEEAIKMYRTITGACSEGVRYFVDQQEDIKESYSIAEITELTKGRYGNDRLVKFFKI